MTRRPSSEQSGFTLVEVLVVLAIILILFGLSLVGLGQPQGNSNSLSVVDTLVNDLKTQQIAAMSGTVGSASTQQDTGILFASSQYTLFVGSAFSAGNSYNFVYSAPTGTTLSTTLPSSTVVFSKGSGDVSGFVNGSNTVTVTSGTISRVITINRFGVITVT